MSVLVTGGAGYIGSHTCVELLNNSEDIVVIDNYYNSCEEALIRVKKITGKSFPYYNCDICDKEGLRRVFRENNIDAVIHFAGLKAVGESCVIPLKYYENNVGGTVTLCEVMKEFGCKRIVFSSSATVYGENNPSPLNENMPTGGTTNPYGTTKYIIERILNDLYKSDTSWSVCNLRYFNPIGAHVSGLIGEDPNGKPNNVMPRITQTAQGKYDSIDVYGNDYDTPDGTGVRDYIHVVDLAKGHIAALSKMRQASGLNVYNLGTGRGYSVLELIHAYEKASGKSIKVNIAPRRQGDIAVCFSDPSKAYNELGWKAEKGIDDMCADSFRWQSENPDGYGK